MLSVVRATCLAMTAACGSVNSDPPATPDGSVDGNIDGSAARCGVSAADVAASCRAIRDDCAATASGERFVGSAGNAVRAWCDMETAGGGWTVLFTSQQDHNASTLPGFQVDIAELRTRATEVLLALRTDANVPLGGWYRAAIPTLWKTQSPFTVAQDSFATSITLDTGRLVATKIHYGQDGWSGGCDTAGWIAGGGNGRICAGDPDAVGYVFWARDIADQCAIPAATTACGAGRHFTIAVRDRAPR